MRRYYVLKGFALVAGGMLLVVGLAGLASLPPSPLPLSLPESLMHLGVGAMFVSSALMLDDLNHLRTFVGGMGGLLVLGKILLVVANWPDLGFHASVLGVICFVSGVCSVLIAAFVGSGTLGR